MKFKRFCIVINIKRIIAGALASALFFNCTAPAYAQMLNDINVKETTQNIKEDYWFRMQSGNLSKYLEELRVQSPVFKASQIKDIIFYGKERFEPKIYTNIYPEILAEESTSESETKPYNLEEFKAEFTKSLNEQAATSAREIQKFKEKQRKEISAVTESLRAMPDIDAESYEAEALANLDSWEKASLAALAQAKKKELSKINERFKDYQKEVAVLEEEAFHQQFLLMRALGKELLALYKKSPSDLLPYIWEIGPVLLYPVSRGEAIFDEAEKKLLLGAFLKAFSWKEISDAHLLNAIDGVGILGNAYEHPYIICDTMEKYIKKPQGASVLLTGTYALLNMKAYKTLKGFIYDMTTKERELGHFDILDPTLYIKGIGNIRGQYLGEISKYGQFYDSDKKAKNVWSEIALIIAQEGSKESLEILRDLGINKCIFNYRMKVNLDYEYNISCNGIYPFFAGALMSGKSGVESFSPTIKRAGEQWFTVDGHVRSISADEAVRSANSAATSRDVLRRISADLGLSPSAAMALHIINSGMGDIPADFEHYLDTTLYKQYKKEIDNPKVKPADGLHLLNAYAVVDAARFASKKSRQETLDVWIKIGEIANIAIAVWCIWSIGKGIYSLGNQALKLRSLARIGTAVERNAFAVKHIKVFRKVVKKRQMLPNLSARVKGSLTPVVNSQLRQFSSLELPKVLNRSADDAVRFAIESATYNPAKAAYTLDVTATTGAFRASTGYSEGVMSVAGQVGRVEQALTLGAENAAKAYANRGWMHKYQSYSKLLAKETMTALKEVEGASLAGERFTAAANLKARIGVGAKLTQEGRNYLSGFKVTRSAAQSSDGIAVVLGASRIPLDLNMVTKISGVKPSDLSKVYILKKPKETAHTLQFVSHDGKAISPDFFKLTFNSEEIPGIINVVKNTKTPITFKYVPQQKSLKDFVYGIPRGRFDGDALKTWGRHFLKQKEETFKGSAAIYLDGAKLENVKVAVPASYSGMSLNINSITNKYSFLDAGGAAIKRPFTFTLPKNQMASFSAELLSGGKNLSSIPNITLNIDRSTRKINTLFYMSAISLSAASTGLMGPLEKNYPDSNPVIIAVGLPYASSLLAPVLAPFVKRYGATKMLLTSNLLAASALMIPTISGFNGLGGISEYGNNPSPWPLFMAAGLTGVSAALTRSSLNPLYKTMDNGGNILKSMMFKNLSSYALILPPAATGIYDYFYPKYYKDANGNNILKNDRPIRKPTLDFSASYPLLTGASLIAAYQIQRMKFPAVGKVKDYKFASSAVTAGAASELTAKQLFGNMAKSTSAYGLEVGKAIKGLGAKPVRDLVIASTITLGVESAALYSLSNSVMNQYTRNNITSYEPLVPVIATTGLIAAPFMTRFQSKKLLRVLGGDNPTGYRNMLFLSLGTAFAGTTLLDDSDDPARFMLGMALVGAGFANTTNSYLKLGGFNLKKAGAANHIITTFDASYPAVHIGMALLPMFYAMNSKTELDFLGKNVSSGIKTDTKNKALQTDLPILHVSMGWAGLLSLKGLGFIPSSVFPAYKGIMLVDNPASLYPEMLLKNTPQISGGGPNLYFTPSAVTVQNPGLKLNMQLSPMPLFKKLKYIKMEQQTESGQQTDNDNTGA